MKKVNASLLQKLACLLRADTLQKLLVLGEWLDLDEVEAQFDECYAGGVRYWIASQQNDSTFDQKKELDLIKDFKPFIGLSDKCDEGERLLSCLKEEIFLAHMTGCEHCLTLGRMIAWYHFWTLLEERVADAMRKLKGNNGRRAPNGLMELLFDMTEGRYYQFIHFERFLTK